MLDLKRYTPREGCDGGFAVVERLGDFDFEPFAGGELQGDFGACEESVEHCCVVGGGG